MYIDGRHFRLRKVGCSGVARAVKVLWVADAEVFAQLEYGEGGADWSGFVRPYALMLRREKSVRWTGTKFE